MMRIYLLKHNAMTYSVISTTQHKSIALLVKGTEGNENAWVISTPAGQAFTLETMREIIRAVEKLVKDEQIEKDKALGVKMVDHWQKIADGAPMDPADDPRHRGY